MSWFFSFTTTAPQFPQASVAALDTWKESGGSGDPEAVEQATVALEAANLLMSSGKLHYLPNDGPYTISLAGHSNPGHKPREGYANDTITVTVTQAPMGGT